MSTKYYFSGIDRASFVELLASEGAAGMVNARNATQPAMLAAYQRWPEIPLVLDSGAFQGVTDVTWYAKVVHEIGDRFTWVANLDVIGNQQASDENWLRLSDEMDVHPLWIYQVEGGEGLNHLRAWLDTRIGTNTFGVGGLVPIIKANPQRAIQTIKTIGEVLEPWRKAHFFGVGTSTILARFAHEPWFASADSQTWLCGFKNRELLNPRGRWKCNDLDLELSREECARQNVRQVHRWLSGRPIQFGLLQSA